MLTSAGQTSRGELRESVEEFYPTVSPDTEGLLSCMHMHPPMFDHIPLLAVPVTRHLFVVTTEPKP